MFFESWCNGLDLTGGSCRCGVDGRFRREYGDVLELHTDLVVLLSVVLLSVVLLSVVLLSVVLDLTRRTTLSHVGPRFARMSTRRLVLLYHLFT